MCDISGEQPITTQSKCDSLLTREPARFKTLLLKVERLKNEEFKHISTEVLVHERGQIKELSCSISAVTSETCEVSLYS